MKNIIIFGAGNTNKNITTYITEQYENVLCIVDNDKNKWGKEINGYSVKEPEYIGRYQGDENTIVIIATLRYHDEIRKQLSDLGWADKRVITAINEIPFFQSMEYEAYKLNIDLKNPLPQLLNLELSGYCNCRCTYCAFHGESAFKNGRKGFMSWETLDAVVELVKRIPSIKTAYPTGDGEIFLHKDWFEMLQKLVENTNIDNLVIYTNGMLLTEENARKIVALKAKKVSVEISIDGRTPEENDEYRVGSKYAVIRDNIYAAKKIFEESNKQIVMFIQNLCPTTLEEIEAKNYKLSHVHETVPQFLWEDFKGMSINSTRLLYCGKELSKFKEIEVEWPEIDGCLRLFYRLSINWEGELIRCSCGYKENDIEGIGSIYKDDLIDLWKHDEVIEKARNNFREYSLEEDFCTGCAGRRKGKYKILVKRCNDIIKEEN